MPHFSLAVIHKRNQNLDDILAPYSVSLEVEPYVAFTKDEAIEYIHKNFPRKKFKSDEERWNYFVKDFTRIEKLDPCGNIISTRNPKARWSSWTIGGRWEGYLRVGYKRKNTARIADISFAPDKVAYKHAIRFWNAVVEHQPTEEVFIDYWGEEYYRGTYKDCKEYAKEQSQFYTYAIITLDGEWHECDDVQYIDNHSRLKSWIRNYYKRFIKNTDSKLYLTIIDCC